MNDVIGKKLKKAGIDAEIRTWQALSASLHTAGIVNACRYEGESGAMGINGFDRVFHYHINHCSGYSCKISREREYCGFTGTSLKSF